MHSRSLRNGTSLVPTLLTTAIVSSCVLCWLNRLNTIVLRPYLDEVFHVRQAQTYWKHQWREWDPKITTPPGLYLVSYLIGALGFLIFRQPKELSASYLRFMNGVVLFSALPILLRRLLSNIWKTPDSLEHERVVSAEKEPGWELHLTVLNISLFPPLFFFSGLYYTDLAAVLIVLEVYRRDLERTSMSDALKDPHSVNHFWNTLFSRQTVLLILFGLVSLLFRQTNIFWTAIFLGGLRVVKTTHSLCVECRSSDIATIARSSWRLRQVYDPPVNMACFEGTVHIASYSTPALHTQPADARDTDYLKACLSIGIMAVANIHIMLIALLPYLVLLGAFGLFVLWNGSVVLGQ
ncbi:glucosyltransferase [Emydomyces testavorans]|uniref:Dol-P-Glc:Glc(2)Man(9)GlcNAc(2)-PP-Dol alpha-1,2-glucosyltransferase n=1 Tax=Emydomyces testavorans TaxID=2070801 RepID=A0AAF0DL96_9EURO|nr:glucosyltransferase [Emydomyces testavorans]